MSASNPVQKRLRLLALSAGAGVLAGLSSALFLFLLDLVTRERLRHPAWLWALPAGGFGIAWAYHHFGGRVGAGHNLVLDEIHDPKATLPARMAPFVLGSTLATHLVGGSAGREGAAVQISASLADQLGRFFRLTAEERRSLLMAGAGAGFGAAIGTPFAGAIFGMEVVVAGPLRPIAVAECIVAALVGTLTSQLVGAPHSHFPAVAPFAFEWHLPLIAAAAGMLFGAAARAFVFVEHACERSMARLTGYPPLRAALGGLFLLGLFRLEGASRYAGLGIDGIRQALTWPASWFDPIAKLGFTALTLASGFKGGEFVPLVFIGTTLGSALAGTLGLSVPLFASLGFAAVFGAGANTPLACAVMAGELFGWHVLPYAWLACMAGYLVSGPRGLYKAQPARGEKHAGFFRLLSLFSIRRN